MEEPRCSDFFLNTLEPSKQIALNPYANLITFKKKLN